MTKFILNVVDGRKGKKTNRGAGEDGDVVDEALGRVMTLKKNRNGDAKYIAKIGNKTSNSVISLTGTIH